MNQSAPHHRKAIVGEYRIPNLRRVCDQLSKDECNADPHCIYDGDHCKLVVTRNNINRYISLITEELLKDQRKRHELLDDQVSTTVDPNVFEYRPDELLLVRVTDGDAKMAVQQLYTKGLDYYEKMSKLYDIVNPITIPDRPIPPDLGLLTEQCSHGFSQITSWHSILTTDYMVRNDCGEPDSLWEGLAEVLYGRVTVPVVVSALLSLQLPPRPVHRFG